MMLLYIVSLFLLQTIVKGTGCGEYDDACPDLTRLLINTPPQESTGTGCGEYDDACPDPTLLIRGGSDACIQNAPWHAILARKDNLEELSEIAPFCGGSLITSRHILSAAHCFWNDQKKTAGSCSEDCKCKSCEGCTRFHPNSMVVYLGVTSRDEDVDTYYEVSDVFLHPDYDRVSRSSISITKGNDLAMVVLEREAVFTPKINTVCLPDPNMHQNLIGEGKELHLFGFGNLANGKVPLYLHKGTVLIDNHAACQTAWNLSTPQICTAARTGAHASDTCASQGDSGGGFVTYGSGSRAFLVGITSFGERDCGQPAVATDTHKYLEWITKVKKPGFIDVNSYYKENSNCNDVVMMAIGDTGSGKSSLLNALLCPKKLYYEYEDCYFQTGSSLETGNSSIVSQTGPWLDNLGEYIGKVTLYDTPGILDPTGADVNNETLRQIARAVSQENGNFSTFLLVLKGTEEFDIGRHSKYILALQNVFGDSFWNHTVIVFTFYQLGAAHVNARIRRCRFDNKEMKDYWRYCANLEAKKENEVISQIKNHFGENVTIPAVFIDSHYDYEDDREKGKFFSYSDKLILKASKMAKLQCSADCKKFAGTTTTTSTTTTATATTTTTTTTIINVNEEKDANGNTALHRAAMAGDLDKVKILIKSNADVNSQGQYGYTPLLWAARAGYTEVVELLLKAPRIDVNAVDKWGAETPLCWVARHGRTGVVELLLNTPGIDVNAADRDGLTPLFWAALFGQTEVVELLLKAPRIDVNAKSNDGNTPLNSADYKGYDEIVRMLKAAGAVE